MRDPARSEVLAVAAPVFIAQTAVGIALFMGATITVQGHSLWAVMIGWWL